MKRALLFLLLLAAGIVILRLSIGEDEVVVAGAPGAPAPAGNPGVRLEQGPIGASWQARGPFHYPRFRSVPEAGGGTRNELVFELDAADSQPVGEGLQQLDGVTVVFHDRGQPAARLVSRQAFLELGRDAGGRASLREDKEIDLRDAVFTTAATSRLPGLRLELDRVLVLVREDYLQLRTPNETDPVLVVLDGKQRGSLRGNGLRARLPRDRRGPLQRADVEVLHDPVFATDGLAVRARGRMSYREDLAAGTAELTVERDVQVETGAGRLFVPGLPGPRGDAAGDGRATVHADELSGWLLRTGEHGDGLVWRLVQLRGAPVAVAAQGLRITAPRLALLPGLFGEPLLATASGGPSRIEQVLDAAERRPGAEPFVASSPRRIHLLRPGEQASAAHRAFGFPRWTVRSVQQQHVVVLEGPAAASTGARAVTASRGLHVFRPDPEVEFAVVQGFGDVSVTQPAAGSKQPELGARGDDGFLLRFAPAGSRLELGPPLPADRGDPGAAWRRHRYELRRGAASVRGVGLCTVTHEGEGGTITLRAPDREIAGRLGERTGELVDVRALFARFDGEALTELLVAGVPAQATRTRGGETLVATAPRIEQIGPSSLCLLPPGELPAGPFAGVADPYAGLPEAARLPRLSRTTAATRAGAAEQIATTAPRIELHHLGNSRVLVVAKADATEPARASGTVTGPGRSQPTALALEAARLRLLPDALPPDVVRAHAGGGAGPLAELPFFALRSAWLLAEDVRRIAVDDPEQGHVEGRAHRLVLSQGLAAGMFVGDPDAMVPATVARTHGARTITATGACVRVFQDQEPRLQALRRFPGRRLLWLPTVSLHEPGGDGDFAHLGATCRGDVDVLPGEIRFGGPVQADGLRPDGSVDPLGLRLRAGQLRMDRDATTGRVIAARGDSVDLDWSRMRARAAELELDTRRNRCTVRDPRGARVRLADGRTLTAEHIEVDYVAMAWIAHGLVLEQSPPEPAKEPAR